eukprot:scaffold1996_cov127-Cylindrotheca_fusiformis.AAC.13
MPTRVVLDAPKKKQSKTPRQNRGLFKLQEANEQPLRNRSTFQSIRSENDSSAPSAAHSKRIVKFRSSIFRNSSEHNSETVGQDAVGLSSTDIRASPRLLGYLYQLLASTVLLITVIKFDQNSQGESIFSKDVESILAAEVRIYQSIKGPVYYWKLIGSAIVGATGAGISLLIVLAHIDTIFLPRLWYTIFRDSSRYEQNLIRLLLVFWMASIHVCTSSLSVGQIQGNVFFTTWIAFAAAAMNIGVWRVSAGYSSIAEKISLHERATTHNWMWSFFFVLTFAGAATDTFFNREQITISHQGEIVNLALGDWYKVLGFCWFFVFVCIMALLFNQFLDKSCELRVFGGSRVILGWRQTEGIIIVFMLVVFFWIIYGYTGVDAVMNGLPNAYFSVWGCFFNSIFLLGTWLRENKKIEYIVPNDSRRNSRIYDV